LISINDLVASYGGSAARLGCEKIRTKEMLNKSDIVGLSAEEFRKISLDFSVTVLIADLAISCRMNVYERQLRDDFLEL
jgi:hypothetical protein